MRESFIFYRSFYESIKELEFKDQAIIYNAIFEYEFNGVLVELKGITKSIFTLILPQLEANNKRYENGKKGGAPKGNQNATKKQPKNNQKTTKKQANDNDNVNVNDNDNVNDIYISKQKNKYGEFKNVLLTEEEYHKLEQANLLNYIDKLSSYVASKGKKYKSHYATILTWARNEAKEKNKSVKPVPEWFNKEYKEELTDETKRILREIEEHDNKQHAN